MKMVARLRGLKSWMKMGEPVYNWRIKKRVCPSCGGNWTIRLASTPMLCRCMSCGLTGTATALLPVIQRLHEARPISYAWEMSTYGAPTKFLRQRGVSCVESEFFPGIASGQIVAGVLCQDATATSFADESFDLVSSNQVVEHIENDLKSYHEAFRILRPGGTLLFAVPLFNTPESHQLARTVDENVEFLRQPPEYHGSRITGPDFVLTFWRFSRNDIAMRVAKAGFEVELIDVPVFPGDSASPVTTVIAAHKPL